MSEVRPESWDTSIDGPQTESDWVDQNFDNTRNHKY